MTSSLKKNFSIVFGTQALILMVSVARALILPKMFSVEDFGYWEVYWFYSTYCGIFCLGFTDGVYLKYGEYNYDQLPIKKIRSSTRIFIGMLLLFCLIIEVLIFAFSEDAKIQFSLSFVAFDIVVIGISTLYIYIFQITNQFNKYGVSSVFDKVLVLMVILYLFIANEDNYRYVVVADFISKIIALVFMVWKAKDIIYGDVSSINDSFREFLNSMGGGIKLLIANLMGMLIMGAGKLVAQLFGNIEEFAIYSFGVSMTGLVLTAVTAFSLVLYPAVKRVDKNKYSSLFLRIDDFTRLLGISSLLLYFPCFIFVESFYPKYSPVLVYLNFLFIIVFLQCKINILNNTFFKSLRKERPLLYINMSCVFGFSILISIFYPLYNDIMIIPVCTCITMSILYFYAKRYLCRQIGLIVNRNSLIELLFIIAFVIITLYLPVGMGAMIMLVLFGIWFTMDYKHNYSIVRSLLKL